MNWQSPPTAGHPGQIDLGEGLRDDQGITEGGWITIASSKYKSHPRVGYL